MFCNAAKQIGPVILSCGSRRSLWVMAAHAAISDLTALNEAVARSAAAAVGYFVTFAMHPTARETGYGYIAEGAAMIDLECLFSSTPS